MDQRLAAVVVGHCIVGPLGWVFVDNLVGGMRYHIAVGEEAVGRLLAVEGVLGIVAVVEEELGERRQRLWLLLFG